MIKGYVRRKETIVAAGKILNNQTDINEVANIRFQ